MLHVRHGWFAQDHWLLPLANIQSVSLSTGPLQRRLDLATVAIDSAGGQTGGLRIRNLAVNEARALVEFLRTWRRRSAYHPSESETKMRGERSPSAATSRDQGFATSMVARTPATGVTRRPPPAELRLASSFWNGSAPMFQMRTAST